jgi:predicted nucleotide-binding protein
MNKAELLNCLNSFRERLTGEVVNAYRTRGFSFGGERFSVWRKKISSFLDENLPGESAKLNSKLTLIAFSVLSSETDDQQFWREYGERALSFIDSLIIDIQNDEYELDEIPSNGVCAEVESGALSNKIFIVHGHDDLTKVQTARFIEKLGFEAIILHEKASRGRTIIEKIEAYTNVGFAIVLYTPDDKGNSEIEANKGILNNRARQNVVFEHGYLIAKLGRDRVVPLVSGNIELPSDISGVVYISDSDWQADIAKEMKDAGYNINFNLIL